MLEEELNDKMALKRHRHQEETAQKSHSVHVINVLWHKEYKGITAKYSSMLGGSHHLGYSCAILGGIRTLHYRSRD